MIKWMLTIVVVLLINSCSDKSRNFYVANDNEIELLHKEVNLKKERIGDIEGFLPVIKDSRGNFVPCQVIYGGADENWDQLVFQVSLEAKDRADFSVDWVRKGNYPEFTKKTQVYLGVCETRNNEFVSVENNQRLGSREPEDPPYMYQYEGPGWESNLIAFRSYFDTRNGKDIFGKITPEMVTHTIGKGASHHKLQPWGMDILKVGSSLGAGALAIYKNDSLVRLGPTETAEFTKVAEGPVMSAFTLDYRGWDVWGQSYDVTEKISIYADKRWYKSEVLIKPNMGDTLVTGIVNLKNASVSFVRSNEFNILMTHGAQSENKDFLGMAILVPRNSSLGYRPAPSGRKEITDTELMLLSNSSDQFTFYFYGGWEMENKQMADSSYFRSNVEKAASQISSNLRIVFDE